MHIFPVSVKPAIPMSVSNFCAFSTVSNSSDPTVQKPSFDSSSFKSTSFINSASQCSFCHLKLSGPKIPTTHKSSISVSQTNHNNFSLSISSVNKSNLLKPACASFQTSHLSPLSIKYSKHLFQSSTQACQAIFYQNQKMFNSASLFQVSELSFQRNARTTLLLTIITFTIRP